jgi:hypothetical protein
MRVVKVEDTMMGGAMAGMMAMMQQCRGSYVKGEKSCVSP